MTCRGIIEPLDNAELARVTSRQEWATMERSLITNVRVLDGTGREPFAGSVSIEGNRIAEVAAGTALPAAAMEVARSAELRVAAHCRSAESVLMALRHGIEVIYHANWADERARRSA